MRAAAAVVCVCALLVWLAVALVWYRPAADRPRGAPAPRPVRKTAACPNCGAALHFTPSRTPQGAMSRDIVCPECGVGWPEPFLLNPELLK